MSRLFSARLARTSRLCALIAAAAVASGSVPALAGAGGSDGAPAAPLAEPMGVHVWREADEDFGGMSGLELSPDGRRFWALSDRGTLRWGDVERDAEGRITGLKRTGKARLQSDQGAALKPGRLGDAEGLAIDTKGRIFVSFEGQHRVARYASPESPAEPLPAPRGAAALRRNSGLEALAVTRDGALLTIPEQWGPTPTDTPVWRFRDGAWDAPFRIERDADWAPVGADVGPDGMLYVLDRNFLGLGGFASRVRRFAIEGDHLGPPQLLVQSRPRQFDNLEGIAVWQDGADIRLTLISDDNFLFLQQTQLVEFRIPAAAPARPAPARAP